MSHFTSTRRDDSSLFKVVFKSFDLRSENRVWGRSVAQRKKNPHNGGFSLLAQIVTDHSPAPK